LRKVIGLNGIAFFIKHPTPGQVKTRLAATLGPRRAAEIYRKLAEAVCVGLPPDVDVIAMFDPPSRLEEIKTWLAPLRRMSHFIPQTAGDLGARLAHAFMGAFALHLTKVAVIGSDCVELTASTFEETWRALETHDCVIGPTEDGGYYLLALRRPLPALFCEIPWSTDRVFAETLGRAEIEGLRVHILPKLRDVDTEDDWRRLERRLTC
jgi:uncharacterized protein